MAGVHDRTGCHTECGRRPVNQDAVLAVRLSDGRELVAVADGMGGHSAGEVASQRALETVWGQLKAGADLRGAVAAANAAVHAAAASTGAWRGMGTTLVALLRNGSSYEIANVGDSRAYRITRDEVIQITMDHSFAAEALREARMGASEIVESRWRNALTRALGTDPHVEVDCFGPFDAREPHAVLLCSDGLYRAMSDDLLREHVAAAEDPWAAARSLAAEAYRNGSSDNISAAVVLFQASEPRIKPAAAAPRVLAARPRWKSNHRRRTERQIAGIVLLLILVVAVLMGIW